MIENDAQLIHRTLSGDETAFGTLVRKYQKSVHALVWRKISDFHFAEEITQDAFFRAYRKLGTLRNPDQFSKWLYVIASRLCINWTRKRKFEMQPLEYTCMREMEEFSYTRYVSEQQETKVTEHLQNTVQKILRTLPNHERRVVMLYYLSEMSVSEIGEFLGVSVNTVKSRLRRARRRLQEKSEVLKQWQIVVSPIYRRLTEA